LVETVADSRDPVASLTRQPNTPPNTQATDAMFS
jgi:hypothetical protein